MLRLRHGICAYVTSAAIFSSLLCHAAGDEATTAAPAESINSEESPASPAPQLADWSRTLQQIRSADPVDTPALIDVLCRIGSAQIEFRDFTGAESSFGEAVELTQSKFGVADSKLLLPLRGLALAMTAREKHAEASEVLQRAFRITQRTDGLLNLGQAPLLDQLADAQTAAFQYENAERTLQHLVKVYERAYGKRDPRVLPAYTRLAEWYSYMGDLESARLILRRVMQIGEAKLGAKSPELIRPLRALSRSYHVELIYGSRAAGKLSDRELLSAQSGAGSRGPANLPPEMLLSARSRASEGEGAILRAVELAEAATTADPAAVLEFESVLLEAGDWFAFKDQGEKAKQFYARAWQLSQSRESTGERPLDSPQEIFFPSVRSAAGRDESGPHQATIEFTVKSDGTVGNVRTIDADATESERAELEKSARAARYRPRFENGVPVDTNGFQYRHVFKSATNK